MPSDLELEIDRPVMLSMEDVTFIVAGLKDAQAHMKSDPNIEPDELKELIDRNDEMIKKLEVIFACPLMKTISAMASSPVSKKA